MPGIEVCLSPVLVDQYELENKTCVVVDVLRATSCFVAGMASGVAAIHTFSDLDACKEMRHQGFLIAGERGGQKVEGFDLGNSPFDYMEETLNGARIAATTTNGTRAIELAAASNNILIGCFLNLACVSAYIQNNLPEQDVVVLCAGWKGRANLEDTLFAGALVKKLRNCHEPSEDSALIAVSAFERDQNNLVEVIRMSAHAQRLAGFNVMKDIEYCSRVDEFDVVPIVNDGIISLN